MTIDQAEEVITLTVLREMRELLSDESRWCKGYGARDEHGFEVGSNDPEACSWCLLGAHQSVAGVHQNTSQSWIYLCDFVPGGCPIEFNDAGGTTHADVLDVLDRTIRYVYEKTTQRG